MINVTCPICKQPMQGQSVAEWPDFPFCSRRCKTIDLGRWLREAYRLPADEADDDEAASDPRETDVP